MKINKTATVVASVFTLIALTGCGSTAQPGHAQSKSVITQVPTTAAVVPTKTPVPKSLPLRIKLGVSSVIKYVSLTEATDGNNLLGRPNGYLAATVLYDRALANKNGVKCDADGNPGVSCGATIEAWPSKDDATRRANYIQTIGKNMPIVGTEYDYVLGNVLLRVSGELTPSVAKKYNAVFGGKLYHL